MTVEELAEEKVGLEMHLLAISMTNVYGMSFEERVKLEIDQIETSKRLNQVKAQISRYENDLN